MTGAARHSPTCVVLLTGNTRAAVASLLVAGPQATPCVDRAFHPASGRDLAEHEPGRIVFGRWGGEHGEEVVVCRREVDRVEIHCHGGRAAARAIIATLVDAGCREVDWRRWVRSSTEDSLAADARIALAGALTERTAMILLDQYTGALRRAALEISQCFAARDAASATARIDRLLAWEAFGAHLVKPWKVALVGPPNVGKSSLINALVGYQRSIVHPTPGTTRDVVSALTAIEGWPVELADTAGLRTAAEPLEAAGIELARDAEQAADLVLSIFDLSQEVSAAAESVPASSPKTLCVFNKCDLAAQGRSARSPGINTSATRGDGIAELARAIATRLVPQVPHAGEPIPFLPDHCLWLRAARTALAHEEWAAAAAAMDRFGR